MNFFLSILLLFLPNFFKRWVLNLYKQNKISRTAKIGFSFIKVNKLIMDDYATIGNFNIIRNIEFLEMKKFSIIKKFNNISNITHVSINNEAVVRAYNIITGDLVYNYKYPSFYLGEKSIITTHHVIDVVDDVKILNNTVIGGAYTQIYTHSFDLNRERFQKQITIGNNCYIGTGSILLASICDNVIIGAGSVVHKEIKEMGIWSSNNIVRISDIKNFSDRVGYEKYEVDKFSFWVKKK